MNEKSQIHALAREQPVRPMMPSMPGRRTHSYVRHGTASIFAALDIASGVVLANATSGTELLRFSIPQVDRGAGATLPGCLHNYEQLRAAYKTALFRVGVALRPHYHVHFTPTSASWINQIERWFPELTRKQLRRSIHTSPSALEQDIRTFIERHNENPSHTAGAKILASVKRSCQRQTAHYAANSRIR